MSNIIAVVQLQNVLHAVGDRFVWGPTTEGSMNHVFEMGWTS